MTISKNKKYSPEFLITASFLILLITCLWIVKLVPNIDYFFMSILLRVYLTITIIFYLAKFGRTLRLQKLRNVDILLIIMTVLGIISVIFSIDKDMAINGIYGRYEGIFSIVSYYALFYIASNIREEHEKSLILSILVSILIFSCIVGIITGLGLLESINTSWEHAASIPYGHPNFFGSVASITVALGIGMFFFSKNKTVIIWGFITYLLGVMAVYSCDSSSPIVGNIMVFLLILVLKTILCIRQKDKKEFLRFISRFVIFLVIYVGLIFFMNFIRDGRVFKEFKFNSDNLKGGVSSNSFMTGRMGIWKAAFKELPNYWLHGAGVDNFVYVAEYAGINGATYYFDKAHNEYLHIMLTEGVASAAVYIGFLFILFIRSLKSFKENVKNNAWIYLSCFMAFFAYIAQAFFNIRIIFVAPYFWIICGILYNNPSAEKEVVLSEKKST